MTPQSAVRAAAALVTAGCTLSTGPGESVLTSQPQWEWRSACCGVGGNELTPETEGFHYVLQFELNGTVRAARNDSILVETRYRLDTSGRGPTADPMTTVAYDEPLPLGPGIEPATSHMLVVLANGGLLLRNLASCADCFSDWRFLPSLAQ